MEKRIVGIQIAENRGTPMQPLITAQGLAGIGLEGDRYATKKGAWSKSERKVSRDISLIESETIDAIREEFGLQLTFELTRRNILTIGIRLNDLVGKEIRIGDQMIVRGVELCDPCTRPGILSGDPDMKKSLEKALKLRGGLRAQIITSGTLHVGDDITLLS